jgi:head-tail adaptor
MSFASMVAKHGKPVTVKRGVTADDGSGGQTVTWTTLHRNVIARFETTSGKDLGTVYDKAATIPDYFVFVVGTLDIKENDRIYMADGREFGVNKVDSFAEQDYQMKLDVTELGRNEA